MLRWGTDHLQLSALACCAACAATPNCNVYVFCSDAVLCGDAHRQCWLKDLADPWSDVDFLRGKAPRWTSGVLGERRASSPPVNLAEPELALVTEAGDIRVRLSNATPLAAVFIRSLLAVAPSCRGCNFYRAEPVPPDWGSPDLPDSWSGGRWGPPYALLQGSLMPSAADAPGAALPEKPEADVGQAAHPVIRRGAVAWAGGGGGSDAFIALADHPEWGRGHVVWGWVLDEDWDVVEALMRRPIVTKDWGAINASVFVTVAPFTLKALRA